MNSVVESHGFIAFDWANDRESKTSTQLIRIYCSANTMKTDLRSSLRSQSGGLPPRYAVRFPEIWATQMESGRYSIPIKFLPTDDFPLDYLVTFAGPIIQDFAEKCDAMIYEAAPELSGWHNRYARGRFKMEDADEIIPHLVPDCVYFAHRTLFSIEFSRDLTLELTGTDAERGSLKRKATLLTSDPLPL